VGCDRLALLPIAIFDRSSAQYESMVTCTEDFRWLLSSLRLMPMFQVCAGFSLSPRSESKSSLSTVKFPTTF